MTTTPSESGLALALRAYESAFPLGVQPTTPDSFSVGLVQHIVFDRLMLGVVPDVSGNENHLKCVKGLVSGLSVADGVASAEKDVMLGPGRASLDITPGGRNTFAFWIYWDGTPLGQMPLGFNTNPTTSLWFVDNIFGFNSNNGDVYGTSAEPFRQRWVHVVVIMTNGSTVAWRLFANGEEQTLSFDVKGRSNAKAFTWGIPNHNPEYTLFGRSPQSSYDFENGKLSDFRVYARGLQDSEIAGLYQLAKSSLDANGVPRVPTSLPAAGCIKAPSPLIWIRHVLADPHVKEFMEHVQRVLLCRCPFHPKLAELSLPQTAPDLLAKLEHFGLTGALFEFAAARSVSARDEEARRVCQLNDAIVATLATRVPDDLAQRLSVLPTLPVLGVPPAKSPPVLQ